jgi:Mrp family chromosome partitioning ATPase
MNERNSNCLKYNIYMSRPVSLTKIVITGNKGGTGKTTLTALLAEYLTYQKKKVNLIDTDPNQALKF